MKTNIIIYFLVTAVFILSLSMKSNIKEMVIRKDLLKCKLSRLQKGNDLTRDGVDIKKNMETISIHNSSKDIELVFVKGGTFQMGDTFGDGGTKGINERPVHNVTVNDYYISKNEITNLNYCEFLNEKGNQKEGGVSWIEIDSEKCLIEISGGEFIPKRGYEYHPVIKVSWYGAKAYCEWAGGRLPTEAEWEYASRGGEKSKGYKYSGSDKISEVAWYLENADSPTKFFKGKGTLDVGLKESNELGINDMTGNVWEWCSDWYNENYYSRSPVQNPKGPNMGSFRVLRGGSWHDYVFQCRIPFRYRSAPSSREIDFGFRLVQNRKP